MNQYLNRTCVFLSFRNRITQGKLFGLDNKGFGCFQSNKNFLAVQPKVDQKKSIQQKLTKFWLFQQNLIGTNKKLLLAKNQMF